MNIVDSLEAVLFVADAPVSLEQLSAALGFNEGQLVQALEVLEARLEERGSICLTQLAGGYQLCTKQEYSEVVTRFLKPRGDKLSKSTMEVLAVIAYRQPITLTDIDAIRGVQSDYSLRVLVEKRLVHEVGRKQAPGRPVLWGTTDSFLHTFKLNDIKELPALGEEREEVKSLAQGNIPTLFDALPEPD